MTRALDAPWADRLVLAIESSCDETCAAVVRGREVLGERVATQLELHEQFGGVVPEIASRRHLELVDVVIRGALDDAGLASASQCDAIAVTRGPGLVGALLVGVAAAKARAWAAGVDLVPVDHLLGHVASALLARGDADLPYLCVLASGGHTLLLDVDENLRTTLLGSTRDDAAGEAFDKGARLLGLPMPGGPALAALAAEGDPARAPFTAAMVHHDTLDTSFAGIKTALATELRRRDGTLRGGVPAHAGASVADLAAGYEAAIVATIEGAVRKLLRSNASSARPRQRLALVGGVAANTRLRAGIASRCADAGVDVIETPRRWCGDNAAMIGVAAAWHAPVPRDAALLLDAQPTSQLFRNGVLTPNSHT